MNHGEPGRGNSDGPVKACRVVWSAPPDVALTGSQVPPGLRVYVIGDIHGRSDLLDLVLAEIEADARRATTRGRQCIGVCLGDYVDRGPDSRAVLDRLSLLPTTPVRWSFLEGNHEAALCAFLAAPEQNTRWLEVGGVQTLASFGVSPPDPGDSPSALAETSDALYAALSDRHRRFLDTLENQIELGDYLFVHAGIRPTVPLRAQSRKDLLSIREPFLSSSTLYGRRVVHGHSVTAEPEFRANRIGIDTGAYQSGRLTCLVLEGKNLSLFTTC